MLLAEQSLSLKIICHLPLLSFLHLSPFLRLKRSHTNFFLFKHNNCWSSKQERLCGKRHRHFVFGDTCWAVWKAAFEMTCHIKNVWIKKQIIFVDPHSSSVGLAEGLKISTVTLLTFACMNAWQRRERKTCSKSLQVGCAFWSDQYLTTSAADCRMKN